MNKEMKHNHNLGKKYIKIYDAHIWLMFQTFIHLFVVQVLESFPDRATTQQTKLGPVPPAAAAGLPVNNGTR